jgi:hypothetical protein
VEECVEAVGSGRQALQFLRCHRRGVFECFLGRLDIILDVIVDVVVDDLANDLENDLMTRCLM